MAVPSPAPSSSSASSGEAAGAQAFSQATASGGAFSLGSSAYNGKTVFYGYESLGAEAQRGRAGQTKEEGGPSPVFATPEQAYQDYFNWTDKQRQDLTAKGIIAGQIKDGAGDLETSAWWKTLVEQSARYGAAGQNVSPMDLADGYVNASGYGLTDQQRSQLHKGSFPAGAIFDASGKYTDTRREGQFIVNDITGERTYAGPQFKTTTERRVDLSDPETAKALTTSIFQQLIGRDPGQGELGQFASALQQAEQANPTTVTSTQQYDSTGQVINTNSTSQGGLTEAAKQQMLEDQLKQTKEYGTQQAATTYMTATKRAIWGGPAA